jgi:hypothetical protein
MERTGEIPKALADRPWEGPDIQFYLECFYALSRHRQSNGFGPSQLDIPSIKIYADAIGYGGDDFEWFLFIISEMDQGYLEFVNEKQRIESQTKAPRKSR